MAIVGMVEDDEYQSESGTLVVRDVGAYEKRGPFSQHGTDVQPCGTIVRTGNGWLEGAAGPGPDMVRVEVHDSAPADDIADWADVVDIPYRSLSGKAALDYVTGGAGGDPFALPGMDTCRVRVARRPVDHHDAWRAHWLLRFWPAEPAPPRWWKRHAAALRPADPGWYIMFSHEFSDLLRMVDAAREDLGEATLESLRQFGIRWNRGDDWLDRPLPGRVPILVMMHPSDVAEQFGMPAPGTLAESLEVFVAAGALVKDDRGYRKPAAQPKPEDVIDMSDRHRDRLVRQRDHNRFCSYAADLVSVALWNGGTQTLAGLADRTLVAEDDVRAALEWAERKNLLRVDGPLDATFTMTP
ncbi:DUF6042 family protein [Actinophytocola sediminis]